MSARREAWVPIPTQEQFEAVRAAVPPQARIYDFGFFPAMGRLIMAHPRIAASFGPLFREIMFGAGKLERREREMVAAVASAAQDCVY
jgi:alkylhydroperoxidase/carboxymuconolactone decarboxylase family protein YurZ